MMMKRRKVGTHILCNLRIFIRRVFLCFEDGHLIHLRKLFIYNVIPFKMLESLRNVLLFL